VEFGPDRAIYYGLSRRRGRLRPAVFGEPGGEEAIVIKSVLVPISGPDASQATLETAFQVAHRFNAHIEALHIRPDPRGLVPYTGEGMDGSMIDEIMDATEREGSDRAGRVRQVFDQFCSRHAIRVTGAPSSDGAVTASWRDEVGREDEIVAVRGRLYDLIVVGRPVRDMPLPSPMTLEAALLDTGRPILVAPPTPLADCGTRIAIAWEGSPEGARAIADALPFLASAKQVTVLACEAALTVPLPPRELMAWLGWHGVNTTTHEFSVGASELGPAILEQSAKVGADLLIKGAYSQSRLRQLILGGRTRHILSHATLPVLLSH
jgi:nucleotide-binding universal stress UspA family protein